MGIGYIQFLRTCLSNAKIEKFKIFYPSLLGVLQVGLEASFYALCIPLTQGLITGNYNSIKLFTFEVDPNWNNSLLSIIILMFIVSILKEFVRYHRDVFVSMVSLEVEKFYFEDTLSSMLRRSKFFFDNTHSGEIVHTLRSSMELSNIYEFLINGIQQCLSMIIILMFCLKASLPLSLCLFLALPLFYFINNKINTYTLKVSKLNYKAEESFESKIVDNIKNINKYLYSGKLDELNKILKEEYQLLNKTKQNKEKTFCLISPIQQSLIFLCLFIISVSFPLITKGHQIETVATSLLFLYFAKRLIPTISQFFTSVLEISKIEPIFRKVESKQSNEMKNLVSFQGIKESIKIKGLTFCYGKKTLFKNFNLEIQRNESIAIIGPSGVGKTTLANLILGLVQAPKNTIFFDQTPIDQIDAVSLRRKFHYLTQKPYFLNQTIKDIKSEPFQTINHVELNKSFGENGINFSGGELKRIQIEEAFLEKKELIILDEPTCNLDFKNSQIIWNAIERFNHGRTVIIITHDLNVKNHVDRVINLNENYCFNLRQES